MRLIVLCVIGLFALPVFADEAAALARLQSCDHDVADDETGLKDLEDSCPGVHDALIELGVASRLQPDWEKTIDAPMLRDVIALHTRYTQRIPADVLQQQSLRGILAGLDREKNAVPDSWWERFKTWLRKMFASESAKTPPWLDRFLQRLSISAAVMRVIVYGLIAVVIGMAIWVVVVELRAAGFFGKRSAAHSREKYSGENNLRTPALTFADFDAASWIERPAILVRLLAIRLIELRQLPAERSLTHRELHQRAQFSKATDRDRFARLTSLAEMLRFGSRAARSDELQQRAQDIIADGRVLLNDLDGERA